jgi:hypothetical protein
MKAHVRRRENQNDFITPLKTSFDDRIYNLQNEKETAVRPQIQSQERWFVEENIITVHSLVFLWACRPEALC